MIRNNQAVHTSNPTNRFDSVIGEGLSVNGELTTKENLRIEGYVVCQDSVVSEEGTILVGETGQVHGDIKADTVIIAGKVVGDVIANNVALQKTANLKGSIICSTNNVEIARGATFDGQTQMYASFDTNDDDADLESGNPASDEIESND